MSDDIVYLCDVAELRRVIHKGACGFLSFAEQSGLEPSEVVNRFLEIGKAPESGPEIQKWAEVLQKQYKENCQGRSPRNWSFSSDAYLTSEARK
jgi:hypothetical protein